MEEEEVDDLMNESNSTTQDTVWFLNFFKRLEGAYLFFSYLVHRYEYKFWYQHQNIGTGIPNLAKFSTFIFSIHGMF